MGTDRELLEAAAKAAGWDSWEWLGGDCLNVYDKTGRHALFNPLNDDGEAFRLAVKLQMELSIDALFAWAMADGDLGAGKACDTGTDIYAATRRAIVRAAAEIGSKT